jgi:hypothetical protein
MWFYIWLFYRNNFNVTNILNLHRDLGYFFFLVWFDGLNNAESVNVMNAFVFLYICDFVYGSCIRLILLLCVVWFCIEICAVLFLSHDYHVRVWSGFLLPMHHFWKSMYIKSRLTNRDTEEFFLYSYVHIILILRILWFCHELSAVPPHLDSEITLKTTRKILTRNISLSFPTFMRKISFFSEVLPSCCKYQSCTFL